MSAPEGSRCRLAEASGRPPGQLGDVLRSLAVATSRVGSHATTDLRTKHDRLREAIYRAQQTLEPYSFGTAT
jgi:hypothetical protein